MLPVNVVITEYGILLGNVLGVVEKGMSRRNLKKTRLEKFQKFWLVTCGNFECDGKFLIKTITQSHEHTCPHCEKTRKAKYIQRVVLVDDYLD